MVMNKLQVYVMGAVHWVENHSRQHDFKDGPIQTQGQQSLRTLLLGGTYYRPLCSQLTIFIINSLIKRQLKPIHRKKGQNPTLLKGQNPEERGLPQVPSHTVNCHVKEVSGQLLTFRSYQVPNGLCYTSRGLTLVSPLLTALTLGMARLRLQRHYCPKCLSTYGRKYYFMLGGVQTWPLVT